MRTYSKDITNADMIAFLNSVYYEGGNLTFNKVEPTDNTIGYDGNVVCDVSSIGAYYYKTSGQYQYWGNHDYRVARIGFNVLPSVNDGSQHIGLVRYKSFYWANAQDHVHGSNPSKAINTEIASYFPISNLNFTIDHTPTKNGHSWYLRWRDNGYESVSEDLNSPMVTSVFYTTVSEVGVAIGNTTNWNNVSQYTKDCFIELKNNLDSHYFCSLSQGNYYDMAISNPVRRSTAPFMTTNLSTTLPIFDIEDIDSIKAFLETGDTSGAIDTELPSVDEVQSVTDWGTNWFMYWDKNQTPDNARFGIKCMNDDINQMSHNLQDLYTVELYKSSALQGDKITYPYYGYQRNNSNDFIGSFDVGNCTVVLKSNNPLDEEKQSNHWMVSWQKNKKSGVGVKILSVNSYELIDGVLHPLTVVKTEVDSGIRYTNTYGESFTIIYHERDSDSAKNEWNSGYTVNTGTDVDSEGSDPSYLSGTGYGTYNVGVSGFNAINDYLWSTDWSTIFSQSTSPISCVCSALQIPFTATGSVVSGIPLAKGTVPYSATKINPVREFTIGSTTITGKYHNFLDTTKTKVLVYLPFCGWHELPTSEIINRPDKYNSLSFKYIVDFVNGLCRCNIYLNGTLRWSFDGNCGVNVPLTSDDHTRAVGNSLKGGGQLLVSTVASAVGGGLVGGGVGAIVGALGGLATGVVNNIPQYNYSSTGSFSGLIESMSPRKITIVVIRPDVTVPSAYAHHNGKPCQLTRPLSTLSGYTVVNHCTVESQRATESEKQEIESMLKSGVYL